MRMGLVGVLGVRGAGGSADDGTGGAHGDDRLGDDRSRHRDRERDAQGARRDRRGEPRRPAGRRRLRARGRAGRRSRRGAGALPRTTTCRTSSCCSPTAGTRAGSSRSTRCPMRSSDESASTRSGSGRPSLQTSRARANSSAAEVFGRRVRRWRRGFGGFGGARIADTPTLWRLPKQTGGTYHAAEDADQLRDVFAELPEGRGDAEAADRDHVDARCARRSSPPGPSRPRSAGARTPEQRAPKGRAGRDVPANAAFMASRMCSRLRRSNA